MRPTQPPTKLSSHPPQPPLQRNTSSRPSMPTRSVSTLTGVPPADAIKADGEAVSDVFDQVSQTGSLAKAAKKLQKYAQAWEDDPEEQEYLETQRNQARGTEEKLPEQVEDAEAEAAPKMSLAQQRMMQAFADEEDGGGDIEMDGGNTISVFEQEEEDEEAFEEPGVTHLQEIQEGLWIGDLVAAMDTAGLEARGITNIVSLLRPRLSFPPQFNVYALEIDDAPDTDILTHLPGAVKWVEEALERRAARIEDGQVADATKKGGVLVHCQAGVSRSSTVVAACLMRAKDLDPVEAVELIRQQRSHVDPSDTFWRQLDLYHSSDGKVTLKDRSTRKFYMERTTTRFMNGDGSAPPMDKMAKYPATPTPSNPPTPSGGHGRRKIRCKMCRRHLAVREHMMDHILDQAPISRPRTPSNFALPSPKISMGDQVSNAGSGHQRRGSAVSDIINPLTGQPGARAKSRQNSFTAGSQFGPLSTMTSSGDDKDGSGDSGMPASPGIGAGVPMPKPTPQVIMTGASPEVATGFPVKGVPFPVSTLSGQNNQVASSPAEISRSSSVDLGNKIKGRPESGSGSGSGSGRQILSADQLSSRLPPQLLALRQAGSGAGLSSPIGSSPASSPEQSPSQNQNQGQAQGQGQGVQSAARRMSMLAMTPTDANGNSLARERKGSNASDVSAFGSLPNAGPAILVNPKCSGYFVEPLTWMEPILKSGAVGGKIVCPNEKCGAKIGNFDWAGVQCGCKEWVTPGFCIHKSKVDEVW